MTFQILIIGGVVLGILVIILGITTLKSVLDKRPKLASPENKKPKKHDKSKTGGNKMGSDIILNAIEDGVVQVDMQKMIQIFNPAASEITGWPEADAVGLDYHSVFKFINDKGEEYKDVERPFTRAFMQQAPIRDNQVTLVTRSNKHVALHMSISPLFDKNKVMTGAVGVFRDVSEERGEERQRAEFISTASHEMRTPVAAIEGYLALAMNDKVAKIDTKARSYLEKAHTSTQHLGRLFQDLLTSARAEDGRLSSHPQPVEMGSFLERLSEDLRFAAEKKSLQMEYIIGSQNDGKTIDASSNNNKMVRPFYYTYADPERLREVITNLFDNATKYTDTGKVSIGLTGDENVVQFYIKDTGAGIAPEDISHLFQKFYRIDNSTTRTIGGTGLGLFICRKIIELYNGRIWVESELDRGSTFFVNLPRLPDQKVKELQAQTSQAPVALPEINSEAKS